MVILLVGLVVLVAAAGPLRRWREDHAVRGLSLPAQYRRVWRVRA